MIIIFTEYWKYIFTWLNDFNNENIIIILVIIINECFQRVKLLYKYDNIN